MDCGMKIIPKSFSDSKISKKVNCARTKAEAIAKNVLAIFPLKNISKKLKIKSYLFQSMPQISKT